MDEVNVKVAVRVRPLLQREKVAGEQSCMRLVPGNQQLVLGKDRAFTFDHVLSPKCTQEELYENCFKPLIGSCFEGYNCTVFAYGQTGSGKTYTIGGGNIATLTEDEFGILPRAIKHIFAHMEEHKHIDYKVKVSYFEVYKEELQDLLDIETSSKDLHIREDDKGNTVIIGAREVECESMEEVMTCLESGSSVRHTGSTQMNEQSSRSHSIFTMLIEQSWCDQDAPVQEQKECKEEDLPLEMTHYMCSKFHFVDLAGSERAHKTGNIGDRFKESVHINTGLLALGNVISALGDPKKKSSHIPYRDAKITRILKDSLGGNAKTLMICCVSPSSANFDESVNSLKYANRAKNITNKPVINRDPQSIRFEEMQNEIQALREELARQRSSIYSGDSVTSARAVQDASQIKTLEGQIGRLRTECAHYRMIAEEAYKQLMEIQQRQILSSSQNIRLKDWLDLMEEIKSKVPATLNKDDWENQTIERLKSQLKKCQEDLKSDEQIFVEKNREINCLRDQLEEMELLQQDGSSQTADLVEKIKKQDQQLVEQQLKMEEMERRLREQERLLSVGSSHDVEPPDDLPPTSARRAKSVPANMIKRKRSSDCADPLATRRIHTSPALISLERVMQGFRARSQLLANQLDDEDDVRQPSFSGDEVEEEKGDDTKPFVRKNTYKVKKKRSLPTIPSGSGGKEAGIQRHGTFGVSPAKKGSSVSTKGRGRTGSNEGDSSVFTSIPGEGDVKEMQVRTEIQKRRIKESQLKLQNANQKMRDLAINIRLKEQLIRDLVKSSKESDALNKQYADKIKSLEKERVLAKAEVADTQRALQELEVKGQHETNEKKRLQAEFQKKIEAAKNRMKVLQRKQMETERMANITGQNEKRIGDLEIAIDRMKQQHDTLNRKLKDESERKDKLERELCKEQQKIRELETRNEQQQKILKIKTEETAALHRRLRSGSTGSQSGEQEKVEEQKRWLDSEIEKVIEQRRKMEELHEELKKREDIIARKESILAEKSELELKKLRSSQHLNQDVLSVANKLEAVEKKLQEKSREMVSTPQNQQAALKEEVVSLEHGRESLMKQRAVLDEKLHEGSLLAPEEERRLIELDEAIDALDAAIEYKTDAIQDCQEEIRRSHLGLMDDNHLLAKLSNLDGPDSKILLTKYFEKVIDLREQERSLDLKNSELETRLDEQGRLIKELELTLDHAGAEMDRRLTQQQQAYEKKIQILMHHLSEPEQETEANTRIQQLEKDLFYYKKTSRDLKRKLREMMARGETNVEYEKADDTDASLQSLNTPHDHGEGGHGTSRPSSVRENKEVTPRSARSASSKKERTHQVDAGGERVSTPVKISREKLRPMTEEEIMMRRSNASQPSVVDSLEVRGSNPWT